MIIDVDFDTIREKFVLNIKDGNLYTNPETVIKTVIAWQEERNQAGNLIHIRRSYPYTSAEVKRMLWGLSDKGKRLGKPLLGPKTSGIVRQIPLQLELIKQQKAGLL